MRCGQDFALLFQELARCGALHSNGSIPAVSIPVLHTAKIAQGYSTHVDAGPDAVGWLRLDAVGWLTLCKKAFLGDQCKEIEENNRMGLPLPLSLSLSLSDF